MNEREVIELGVAMRAAQKAYFSDRSTSNLQRAKGAERDFDYAAAKILSNPAQSDLFAGGRG